MTDPGDSVRGALPDDDGFGASEYEVAVAHHALYTRVTVTGMPSMEQMVLIVRVIGETSAHWRSDAVLVDTTRCGTPFTRAEQYRLGEEAAASLGHLRRMAALVAPERYTGQTEKGAQRSGANGRVFTSRSEAVAWVSAPD